MKLSKSKKSTKLPKKSTKRISLRGMKLLLPHEIYGAACAAWFIVRDPCAGLNYVYTVHRISLVGFKETVVIGRELPLDDARRIVREDMEAPR